VPGRLFVVRSDLTRITCDAWLLPTDPWLNVTKQWLSILPSELRHPDEFRRAAPKAFGRDRHTFAVEASSPVAVATSIGGLSLDAILKNVREFLDLALEMRPVSTVRGRKVPLFALPLVGTGRGGWSRSKGDVVGDVVAATSEWAAAHEADACLVVDSAQAFAAAQSARRQLRADRSLPPRLRPTAQALGARAALDRLVLFVGAGVRIPAGLPHWIIAAREHDVAARAHDVRGATAAAREVGAGVGGRRRRTLAARSRARTRTRAVTADRRRSHARSR